ncbi:uncharacterized protein K452DRAFT_331993 [Aplosporella prunicola CBS 121167]|uniref:Sodium bile acid symporter family protein n=1 Tax=Aplosporella prunicola CBS 121167 TaxID=1176127 RepID=A0A6A6BHJ4_9PEZI|nr:uncharacterized protein K452DRAFT_331993 [Aplosporella prunicola CBS 121167]KAF2142307.1 hypothetical protein K452DRAFT_331993 [Aplosporella prunicola CBS 121167]
MAEEKASSHDQQFRIALPLTANSQTEANPQSTGTAASKPSPSRALRVWHSLLWLIKDQWFLVVMLILILIASQVQVPGSQQRIKQKIIGYLAVALIFFINGCTIPSRVLLQNIKRWDLHLFVQAQCYLLTSAIAYGIVSACATNPKFMDPALLIGIIVLGCLPTTISFNTIMTRKSNGNTALTLTQSTIGNFLGPFISTALIRIYTSTDAWYTEILPKNMGSYGETYRKVFAQLGFSVFLPLFVGQIVMNAFPALTKKVFADWKMSKLSSLSLLTLIWQTYDEAFQSRAFSTINADNMIFFVFMSFGVFLLWMALSIIFSRIWLSKEDTISVAFCVPSKTPAMGVPLTTIMFAGISAVDQSKIHIPMVIFQGIQTGLSSLISIPLRMWQAHGKNPATEE